MPSNTASQLWGRICFWWVTNNYRKCTHHKPLNDQSILPIINHRVGNVNREYELVCIVVQGDI